MTYSGVAVAATGITVSGGVALQDQVAPGAASATVAAAQAERNDRLLTTGRVSAALADRGNDASRSERRVSIDKAETRSKKARERANAESLADQDPRDIARSLMGEYGLSTSEFGCLDQLWVSESDWDPTADNPTSSAYGIPQALTGGTHDNLPADYMTNPVSQIRWGLWYISESYGTACAAWEFKRGHRWY